MRNPERVTYSIPHVSLIEVNVVFLFRPDIPVAQERIAVFRGEDNMYLHTSE